jgi:uncharacterized damage-inducible protein DinB
MIQPGTNFLLLASMSEYNGWANHQVLETAERLSEEELVREASPSHHSVLRLLSHMYAIESNFLLACQGETFTYERPAGLNDLRQRWEAVMNQQAVYLPALTETALAEVLPVTIGKRPFQFPRWQMLSQALVHSIIHRGELSTVLTGMGHPLPNLDIILRFAEESGQEWPWK